MGDDFPCCTDSENHTPQYRTIMPKVLKLDLIDVIVKIQIFDCDPNSKIDLNSFEKFTGRLKAYGHTPAGFWIMLDGGVRIDIPRVGKHIELFTESQMREARFPVGAFR